MSFFLKGSDLHWDAEDSVERISVGSALEAERALGFSRLEEATGSSVLGARGRVCRSCVESTENLRADGMRVLRSCEVTATAYARERFMFDYASFLKKMVRADNR